MPLILGQLAETTRIASIQASTEIEGYEVQQHGRPGTPTDQANIESFCT